MSNSDVQMHVGAEAWIQFHLLPEDSVNRAELFWAYSWLDNLIETDPERAWTAINVIRSLDTSETILANIAAGPLESLLAYHGTLFIERIETAALSDPQLRKLLGAVWKNSISELVWLRLKAIADPSW